VTLLEALVALVVLGLTAVAALGALQSATRLTREADVWTQAIAYAESSMEGTKLGAAAGREPAAPPPPGFGGEVAARPWPGSSEFHGAGGTAPGLEQVTVTVWLPGGGSFSLHRLARTR
jgi:type II secretory pathway pseudopilin PulG